MVRKVCCHCPGFFCRRDDRKPGILVYKQKQLIAIYEQKVRLPVTKGVCGIGEQRLNRKATAFEQLLRAANCEHDLFYKKIAI